MTDEDIARLRARLDLRSDRGLPMLMTSDDARGLLDEIERLTSLCRANNTLARMEGKHRDEWRERAVKAEEENESLRGALEPFARIRIATIDIGKSAISLSDDDTLRIPVKVGDLRRLRRAVIAKKDIVQ